VRYRVVFSPQAQRQLSSVLRYLAGEGTLDTATSFVAAIVDHCESFTTFPNRGARRDDIRPGLHTIGFRRRVTIAFMVEDRIVSIVGVFYGGQNVDLELRRIAAP
jgi:toxin ParE1/3/4